MDKERKAENNKQAKESAEILKDCAKDGFFGVWADKQQDVHAYMRDMRQGRKI